MPSQRPASRLVTGGALRPSPRFAPLVAAFGGDAGAVDLDTQIRSSPYFAELVAAGALSELVIGRRVPAPAREVFALTAAVDFIRRYRLDEQPEWTELLAGVAPDRAAEIAANWGVPPDELRSAVNGLKGEPHTDNRRDVGLATVSPLAGSAGVPVDALEALASFCDRHAVTQQQFVDRFLHASMPAADLAALTGIAFDEIDEAYRAIASLGVLPDDRSASVPVPAGPPTVVAAVAVAGDELTVDLLANDLRRRFRIDHTVAADWVNASPDRRPREEFLQWIRAANERASARLRILTHLCVRQRRFLVTGAPADLVPVTQSDVAKETSYHRSVVSRMVRSAVVRAPHGLVRLRALAPGRGAVVRALAARQPHLSDADVASWLQRRFGIRISPRTVNYHRHRTAVER